MMVVVVVAVEQGLVHRFVRLDDDVVVRRRCFPATMMCFDEAYDDFDADVPL